jgi:hypothetical protein
MWMESETPRKVGEGVGPTGKLEAILSGEVPPLPGHSFLNNSSCPGRGASARLWGLLGPCPKEPRRTAPTFRDPGDLSSRQL